MGSPLSPLVSNLVMEDVEKRSLLKLSFKPILYKRYVDDILRIVPTDKIAVFFDAVPSDCYLDEVLLLAMLKKDGWGGLAEGTWAVYPGLTRARHWRQFAVVLWVFSA